MVGMGQRFHRSQGRHEDQKPQQGAIVLRKYQPDGDLKGSDKKRPRQRLVAEREGGDEPAGTKNLQTQQSPDSGSSHKCCGVVVRHLSKGHGCSAQNRVGGPRRPDSAPVSCAVQMPADTRHAREEPHFDAGAARSSRTHALPLEHGAGNPEIVAVQCPKSQERNTIHDQGHTAGDEQAPAAQEPSHTRGWSQCADTLE